MTESDRCSRTKDDNNFLRRKISAFVVPATHTYVNFRFHDQWRLKSGAERRWARRRRPNQTLMRRHLARRQRALNYSVAAASFTWVSTARIQSKLRCISTIGPGLPRYHSSSHHNRKTTRLQWLQKWRCPFSSAGLKFSDKVSYMKT